MILLDTNVFVRLVRPGDPQCTMVRNAVHALLVRGEKLVIVPQNLYEFWAVATRAAGPPPVRNGLSITVAQAGRWLQFFQRRFTLLPDQEALVTTWRMLVETHGITGFRAHDVRLVAAMQTHGIDRLLTLNAADFRGLPITIVDPNNP